jgi:hypothetical protein
MQSLIERRLVATPGNVLGLRRVDASLQIVGQRNDWEQNERQHDECAELHANRWP